MDFLKLSKDQQEALRKLRKQEIEDLFEEDFDIDFDPDVEELRNIVNNDRQD